MAAAPQTLAREGATAPRTIGILLVNVTVGLLGLLTLAAGIWSFGDPASFARFVNFPEHTHFLHDIGAFQIGIGTTLLLALIWRDAIAVALGGFFVGNTVHVTSHLMDIELGGRPTDWILLGIVSIIALAALIARLRRLRQTTSERPGASS